MDKEDILREVLPELAERRRRQRELTHARELHDISQPSKPKDQHPREQWSGPVYALAQAIESRHRGGEFGELSLEKAFEWAANHYVQEIGKPFTARSLRESLRSKKERG
jgi:hypothetical protein